MPDLVYIVTCDGNTEFRSQTYQCNEPERGPSANEWFGGFSFKIDEAILYPDYESAKKTRNRLAKIYSNFKIRVISKNTKEIFMMRLAG